MCLFKDGDTTSCHRSAINSIREALTFSEHRNRHTAVQNRINARGKSEPFVCVNFNDTPIDEQCQLQRLLRTALMSVRKEGGCSLIVDDIPELQHALLRQPGVVTESSV